MIDFHSHILPGIDDGSKNVGETISLLKEEYDQGVRRVIFTPHFYAQKMSIDKFLKKRESSFAKVKDSLSENNQAPAINLGAEVYYFPRIGEADEITKLCVEGTQVMLLELPFCQWDEQIYKDVKHLVKKRKLIIVLAHIERYYSYQKDKEVWERIMNLPLYVQINCGAFQEWKKRRFAISFIKKHENVLLGTDCHNLTRRVPNMLEGRQMIQKKLGMDSLNQIDELGERILDHE